jgi:phage repressor protein C with HTH and peptisase S24 domain
MGASLLSHSRIWAAIDELAERHGLTASGLARRAGLDPTTFNRSKRTTGGGRKRWPSTESLAKILEATGAEMGEFVALLGAHKPGQGVHQASMPVLGFAQAGGGGFALDLGNGAEEVAFPGQVGEASFALRVKGESMAPLYRNGDTIIVDRDAPCRKGDRVVVKTKSGEVMAKVLQRKTARVVELGSLNPSHPERTLNTTEIDWMGRIAWASQ